MGRVCCNKLGSEYLTFHDPSFLTMIGGYLDMMPLCGPTTLKYSQWRKGAVEEGIGQNSKAYIPPGVFWLLWGRECNIFCVGDISNIFSR